MLMDDRRSKEDRGTEPKSGSRKRLLLAVFFSVILILPVILFLLWLRARFAYDEGYDSPQKLRRVYQQYESDFQNAKQVFTQLPEHAAEGAEDCRDTIIRSADGFVSSASDAGESNLMQRTYKTLQISSPIPYSESEYEQIYSAASPLMEKLSLDRIIVFSDRKQIYFVVFDDNREWVGHADVIMYDANIEVLEGKALDEYIAELVSQRQPVELELVRKGWIVFSQGES